MSMHQQRSPMLFDIDSPYMQRLRKMSAKIKDSADGGMNIEFVQKSSDGLRSSLKVPSIRLEKVLNRKSEPQEQNEEVTKAPYERSMLLKSQQKRKKVAFYRQKSQPQQISHHSKHPVIQSSSNNQNVRKRLTSLQKYFEQTRSIQLPYATKNRLNQNQRFLSEIKQFQTNLSRVKGVTASQMTPQPMTQRNQNSMNKRNSSNRLSQTRPKPLKIHELQNQNVKKEKNSILVEKFMKDKLRQYRQSLRGDKPYEIEDDWKKVPLDYQLNILGQEVENILTEMNSIRKVKREREKQSKMIREYFAFLK